MFFPAHRNRLVILDEVQHMPGLFTALRPEIDADRRPGRFLLLGSAVSLGLIITFIGYTQQFNRPVQQISVLWTNIQNAVAGGERIFGLLDEEPELHDRPDAIELPPVEGHVVYDDVW